MRLKKNILITLLFAFVIVVIMSPIATHEAFPHPIDFTFHVVNIFEAQRALLQGQFPIRIAPDIEQGWLYPIFQFYAPFAYTVSGLMGFVILHNPWAVYKFTIGLAAIVGAWYCYKLYVFLFKNEIAALLGAVLYLFSPYLLLNINLRGDFGEAFAQGILPVMIYYAFRLFYAPKRYCFGLGLILASYCLLTSHVITFVTSSFFLGLFLIVLALREKRLSALISLIFCFCFSLVLAAWYLGPIILLSHDFNIANQGGWINPWVTNFYTMLPVLLGIKSVSGNPLMLDHLTPAIGLILSLTIAYWIYESRRTVLINIALILFLIVFVITWSPFNFWQFLPHSFYFIQFSFRLITNLMWLGGILFVAMLVNLFPTQFKVQHALLGLFCIGISGSLWLTDNYQDTAISVHSFKLNGFMEKNAGYYAADYLLSPHAIQALPVLVPIADMQKNCTLNGDTSICTFSVSQASQSFQLPVFYYPELLKVSANGHPMPYYPSLSNETNAPAVLASITLSKGSYKIKAIFVGLYWANDVSWLGWILYGLFLLRVLINAKRRRL